MEDFAYFSISDGNDKLRLKAFTSASTGTCTTIRITIETDDLQAASYALRGLAAVQRAQKREDRSAKPGRQKPLALPAPGDF
jgi:hypothetical protein